MNQKMDPIDYAKAACDTMMRRYKAAELPPQGHFLYHQGVFLSGMYKTYQLCGDEAYFIYIKNWVDSVIDDTGNVHFYDPGQLDYIQPGVLLYPLFERTGDKRYKKALDTLLPVILNFPTNPEGGLWHKDKYPNQMWLDGLYMAGPVSAEYAYRFQHPEYLVLVEKQAMLMVEKTKDKNTGLLYHAWDSSKKAEWADPETGLSPEFWGRSIGWVPVALLDDMDFMPEKDRGYDKFSDALRDLMKAVVSFQSEDGRWYQVVNKPDEPGNWLENSCSCLFTAALCKAVRKGILDKSYLEYAESGFRGVIRSIYWEGLDIRIGNVCIGTGVGDYRHYCDRPVSVNDLHGVGAFLLMCTEMQRLGL